MQEQKIFRIPIEEYTDVLKSEKRNEILELFKEHNKLRSKKEYKEIEYELRDLCRKGDLELIQIYLSESIEDESKQLIFKIDETTKTASLFKVSDNLTQIFIPRSIKHETSHYLITSICRISFAKHSTKKTIMFSNDSAVSTIYNGAFYNANVEEIHFPSSLKELKEGWCFGTNHLTKIMISPSNNEFEIKDGKYLLGKSDPKSFEFDKFLFATRDIEEIFIPSKVTTICEFALSCCKNLRKVEISTDSNLQTIELNAFYGTGIEEIFIPSKVTTICENTFSCCKNLRKVEIPTNSNLQRIGSNAFSESNIEKIFIPSKVTKICEYAFAYCKNLRKVEIPTNSNLQVIKSNAFIISGIEEIFIPSKVTTICRDTFYKCVNFRKIKFPTDSNLQTIESGAFTISGIEEISIPSKVTAICGSAFYNCKKLRKVEIPTNSNLQTIGYDAFSLSKIKNFFIPAQVTLMENAFNECKYLKIIEISAESKLNSLPFRCLLSCQDPIIMIPSSLKVIINCKSFKLQLYDIQSYQIIKRHLSRLERGVRRVRRRPYRANRLANDRNYNH